jgi:hypothetical protein
MPSDTPAREEEIAQLIATLHLLMSSEAPANRAHILNMAFPNDVLVINRYDPRKQDLHRRMNLARANVTTSMQRLNGYVSSGSMVTNLQTMMNEISIANIELDSLQRTMSELGVI